MTNAQKVRVLLVLLFTSVEYAWAAVTERPNPGKPTSVELLRTVGASLSDGFKSVKWKAGELPGSNMVVYAVQPPQYDEAFLKRLALAFGVNGQPTRMPPDMVGAPGYWVRETSLTNHLTPKTVFVSQDTGQIGFGSGDDNHLWDLKNHQPLTRGVPTPEEALRKTLDLLPILGLTTNDLEHRLDGSIHWEQMDEGTWYIDLTDKKRKRYIRQMNVILFQHLPAGGMTAGIGGGGQLRAGYMSEGKLAELELLFRPVKPLHTVKPKTKAEVISALRKGQARSFYEQIPRSITVTNCALVYPQGNEFCHQSHLWPFYSVKGYGAGDGATNAVILYVPVGW